MMTNQYYEVVHQNVPTTGVPKDIESEPSPLYMVTSRKKTRQLLQLKARTTVPVN